MILSLLLDLLYLVVPSYQVSQPILVVLCVRAFLLGLVFPVTIIIIVLGTYSIQYII